MKPFFGFDLTKGKGNGTVNGDSFCVARPTEAAVRWHETSLGDVRETLKGSRYPLIVRILEYVFLFVALSILGGLIASISETPLRVVYERGAPFFWVSAVCFALFLFLAISGRRKWKAVVGSEDTEREIGRLNEATEAIFSQLGAPESADEINAFGFFYREKNGEIRPCRGRRMQYALYFNFTFKAYVKDDDLCLTSLDGVLAIPLNEFKAIRTVKKRVVFSGWSKDEPWGAEKYKPFVTGADAYGGIHCKWYHVLEFEHDGETWGIWFPNYELPAYEKLTGLKAEE